MSKNPWIEVATKRAREKYYPSIPAPEEILMHEKFFKKIAKKNDKVLVLGATPFLRDLGLKYKCQVVAADISLEMILKMSEYMKYKNNPNEILVRGNWLNLPLQDHYFDIVLADFSFNNIKPEEHIKLFQELKRLLKPKGYFLTRQRVHSLEKKLRSYSDLARLFRKKKILFRDFKYEAVFAGEDLYTRYNQRTKIFLWGKFFESWEKAYRQDKINKKEFEMLYQERNKIITSLFTKKDWEKMFKKYFKILKIDYCKKYTSSISAPFYLGKTKK